MSDKSSIEWTDATWNPIRGTKGRHHCVRISEGCKHCYAATMNHRFKGPDYVKGADTPRLDEEALLQPLRWKAPRRIFVCSMTDLFMDEHTNEMIASVFAIMAMARQHTFQVLTKRSERMRAFCLRLGRHHEVDIVSIAAKRIRPDGEPFFWTLGDGGWSLPNVWLGVSAENQERADERIPDILATPAAVRFVSAEPLLGPIKLPPGSRNIHMCVSVSGALRNKSFNGMTDSAGRPLTAREAEATLKVLESKGVRVIPMDPNCQGFSDQTGCPGHRNRGLDWVIVGGESGPGARPCDVSWIRSIKDQCAAAGVACFVKQLGAKPTLGTLNTGAANEWDQIPTEYDLNDSKGGDMSEWPADLRVRQMPGELVPAKEGNQ